MASRPISCISRRTRLAVDLVSVISEPGSHPSGAVERCLQVLLVYEGHQLQVLGVGLGWQVVQRGAADTQQRALAHQRQLRFFSVNHGPALGPAHNPKLRDKKSRSTLSCPILLVELGSEDLLVLLLASSTIFKEVRRPLSQGLLPGMDLARVDFKPAGQLCNVCSPWSAAKATLALKTGLCFLRVCFMSCSFFPSYLGAGLSLSHLSEFWGPPQYDAILALSSVLVFVNNEQEIKQCLQCCYNHLELKGILLLELPNHSVEISLSNHSQEVHHSEDHNTIVVIQSAVEGQDWNETWHIFRHNGARLNHKKVVCQELLYSPTTLTAQLQEVGFDVIERYGDLLGNPFDESSSWRRVLICEKRD